MREREGWNEIEEGERVREREREWRRTERERERERARESGEADSGEAGRRGGGEAGRRDIQLYLYRTNLSIIYNKTEVRHIYCIQEKSENKK